MKKRLVWNFEIDPDTPLQYPPLESTIDTEQHWESRFFWNADEIITLAGLSDDFLALSRYSIKHRQDTYYLLPHADYNLKERHGQLFYKPLLLRNPQALAYGKKIALHTCTLDQPLPGCDNVSAGVLIQQIQKESSPIVVEKEAMIYRIPTTPSLKIEFARLLIDNTVYFSLSIESRALSFLESMTTQLLGSRPTCDYITFLKQH